MKLFSSLKTSEKFSMSFALLGFFSLFLFLLLVNITYFFIWYADQKEMSFSHMNKNYSSFTSESASQENINEFRNYLMTQDTMIIPKEWDLICSPWVAGKIKENPEQVKDRYFYLDWEDVYFIYSKNFDEIWEVKVFFDTTSYIASQITIIKVSLVFMFVVFLFQYFFGRIISKRLLGNLEYISRSAKDIDINNNTQRFSFPELTQDDEILILSKALNESYDTIDLQTSQLKQFLTDVSHEFKTPLMVMNSHIDLLEKKNDGTMLENTDLKKYFSAARKHISKLNWLLESLFFLSRTEEKKSCLVKSKSNLASFVNERVELLQENFPHKNIVYIQNIPKDLQYEIEENTFSILIDNLISNAIKFSPDDSRVEISANTSSFTISDNWPWISKEEAKKIWDKFYRKDTNIEGFWVGLYLVKRILDIYDWKISVWKSKLWWAKFKVELKP